MKYVYRAIEFALDPRYLPLGLFHCFESHVGPMSTLDLIDIILHLNKQMKWIPYDPTHVMENPTMCALNGNF